jgi:SAM-dependent methyltransferase
MKCRHCKSELSHTFLDLGFAPPSNAYLTEKQLTEPEKYFPLKLKVCTSCWLVQTEDYALANELFNDDYAYYSSTSTSWLAHAANYCEMVISQLRLTKDSFVIEIASNDGYLLKNFVKAGIPCLGIEPTTGTAEASEKLGVPVLKEFFTESLGTKLAISEKKADLIAGNNVYAHVPDINDFTRGLKAALKPTGTITLEFPHLMQLIQKNQFDTVYHEHFSYLSLYTVSKIFQSCGLRIYDVDQISTHGGSLRVFGCHDSHSQPTKQSVARIMEEEINAGLQNLETYMDFQRRTDQLKDTFLTFLIEQKKQNKCVVAYGAAAKGNTILNYAGVKKDLLPLVADAAPSKQGMYLPGSHIPIVHPSRLVELNPDFVIILPWNIVSEVLDSQIQLKESGCVFVSFIPTLNFH